MREGDEERVAVHEAGHAVAYFVIGRPIVRAIVAEDEHEVEPVPGSHVNLNDEAVAIAAGWAAEERRLRILGTDQEEIYNVWLNGGHHDDRAKVEALAARVETISVEDTEHRAERLLDVYWELVLIVANALRSKSELDQRDLVGLASRHGLQFEPGDQAVSRTSALLVP